MKYIRR